MEYKPLLIRLLEDDYDWLDRHSFETKLSKAEIIRRGLILYREKEAKTMTKLGWEVIEDGGGGLHLFVFDGGEMVYAASEWELSPGVLREALADLRETGTVDGWEEYEWGEIDPQDVYDGLLRALDQRLGGAHLIADQNGIYYDRMGAAGKNAFFTTAMRIAELLDNDGQSWETDDGRDLDALAGEAGATVTHDDSRDLTRYLFSDGSAIVAGEGGWDIEGDEPFSWAGEQ